MFAAQLGLLVAVVYAVSVLAFLVVDLLLYCRTCAAAKWIVGLSLLPDFCFIFWFWARYDALVAAVMR